MGNLVLIKGGGDIASGIAHRLYMSGFAVVITELPQPTAIRRMAAFAQAVFSGRHTVEGVTAVLAEHPAAVAGTIAAGMIPVLVDPAGEAIVALRPGVIVDARLAKRNLGTTLRDAPTVIGVGPGFFAGRDVHAVVETLRGHDLGRVIWEGAAAADTGVPGEVGGYTSERVLRAPGSGRFVSRVNIGDFVRAGDVVAAVGDAPVQASLTGIVRGLLHDGITVTSGMKIGDIDPRCSREYCFTISDKARAVGGGVLEAILHLARRSSRRGCCPDRREKGYGDQESTD